MQNDVVQFIELIHYSVFLSDIFVGEYYLPFLSLFDTASLVHLLVKSTVELFGFLLKQQHVGNENVIKFQPKRGKLENE